MVTGKSSAIQAGAVRGERHWVAPRQITVALVATSLPKITGEPPQIAEAIGEDFSYSLTAGHKYEQVFPEEVGKGF